MIDKVLIVLMAVLQLKAKELTHRLSRDVIPQHYTLKLHPNIDEDTFQGEVTITVYSNIEKEFFALHSSGLNITYASVSQLPADVLKGKDSDKISIRFRDSGYFQPGEHLIYLKFVGKFQKQFGLRKVTNYDRTLVVNEFEPNFARSTFPCFDEPSFKARFSIRLVTPNDTYRAISNMPEIGRYPTPNGIIYDFATSVRMSTYLISLAITDYQYYEELFEYNNKSIPIRVYTINANKKSNSNAIEAARIALKFYTEYSGIEYPLPKLDFIEYNKMGIVATETWGLIQFDQGLLHNDSVSYDSWQRHYVMFHELGHSWFGNLVTNDWWNDIWLHEGFSNFMSYKLTSKREGSYDSNRIKLTELAAIKKSSNETTQLVFYIKSEKDLEKCFGKMVYTKGTFLLMALEALVGERAFKQAVSHFLKKHAFYTATSNNLISEFEHQVPNMNVRSFLESYLYQPDFPVVNVDDSTGTFLLRQVRKDNLSYKWTIPISYKYANNTTGLAWLDKDVESVELEKLPGSDWIFMNTVERAGIYAVNYTGKMWTYILNHTNEFSSREILHITENVVVLYQLKYINCDTVLKFISKVEESLAALLEVSMDVARNIACFDAEYSLLLKYLNQIFHKVDVWLDIFNVKCDQYGNSTTDHYTLQCMHWISRNLGNLIET